MKALPGNPYDGHTLSAVLPDIESTIGAGLERIVTDAGYKGHNAPKHQRFKSTWQVRSEGSLLPSNARSAGARPWSHDRSPQERAPDGRNHLAGRAGDAANAVLAAVGYNFGLLLRWLALCCASCWPSSQRQQLEPDHRSVVITATSRATRYGKLESGSSRQSQAQRRSANG